MDELNFHIDNIVREDGEAPGSFEGPLNLILMLVQKNRIEIRDLKISDILDQYLEYLDRYRSMDLEVASEFVLMASHLLYIKTKSVLSKDDENPELEFLISSLEQLKERSWTSLLVQWIKICLPVKGTQVQSLDGPGRLHMPPSN